MSENSFLNTSQPSVSDFRGTDSRTSDLASFCRDPGRNEPERGSNGARIRYCNQPNCLYNSAVVSNFRRHLVRTYSIYTTSKPLSVQVLGVEELENLYITTTGRTKEELQAAVFKNVLNKNVIRKALVRLIVLYRLSFFIVHWLLFYLFIRLINPAALEYISTFYNTIRSDILSLWKNEKIILQNLLCTARSKINIFLNI